MSDRRVEPDGMVHDLYDGRFWPAEIEDEPFYNRSTILREGDLAISRAIAECDHNGERALRRFLTRFKEVVE